MLIGDLSRATGLSVDTIRFYEKIGLLRPAARNSGGRRVYDADALRWVAFLAQLNATGMKQADRVRYAALRDQGDATVPERRSMLETHRAAIRVRLDELQATLGLMDDKIAQYRAMEAARSPEET